MVSGSDDPGARGGSALQNLPEGTKALLQSFGYAFASALMAILFLTATNYLFKVTFVAFSHYSLLIFLPASFVTIVATSFVSGLLIDKVSPEAAGSGIPQVKVAYWKDLGYIPLRQAVVKFVAGILSIGGGTSLGREGPTVFMGGSVASNMAGVFKIPRQQRRAPAIAGAAAGLAAAFNTPLASITFVLEEIVGDINSRTIGRVVLASVVGAFTVYAFLGNQPAFALPDVRSVTWWIYLAVPLASALAALAGVAFQKGALWLRGGWRTKSGVPRLYGPTIAGVAVWVIGVLVYVATGKLGVFSLGYIDLSQVLTGQFPWVAAGVLLVAKLVATIISYALGGAGGIFSPLLFLGGMSGFFMASLLGHWLPLTTSDIIVISAVGMSSALAAVLKTPLSALLIVFEMTHQFAMVPSLLIGLAVSTLVGRLAGPHNFYDALLLQDGHKLIRVHPPRDLTSWRNTEVAEMTLNAPVFADSLDAKSLKKLIETWPYHRFPIKSESGAIGLITRNDIEAAIKEGRPVPIHPAVFCSPSEKFRDVENKFLDNPIGAILIREPGDSNVRSILTLHDLIRLQASLGD